MSIVVLVLYRKGLPYLVALASHSLIGDLFTSYGVQLFWPISSDWINANSTMMVNTPLEIAVELFLFLVMGFVLILSEDFPFER